MNCTIFRNGFREFQNCAEFRDSPAKSRSNRGYSVVKAGQMGGTVVAISELRVDVCLYLGVRAAHPPQGPSREVIGGRAAALPRIA
jgi:hypothetical protein